MTLSSVLLLLAVLSAASVWAARQAPETGRIRLLFTGELHGNVNLFADWYKVEPRMTIQIVPSSPQDMPLKDARRQARLYMPRSYEELVGLYDCVIVEDLNPEVLPSNFVPNFRRSVVEDGLGAILVEFVYWFGNGNRIDLWMASSFYDIIPADIIFGEEIPRGKDNFYQLMTDSKILALPGIETHAMNMGHHGTMLARPGSQVLAKWRGTDYDCVTMASAGHGSIIQIGHGWDNIPPQTAKEWEYLQDYAYNLVFGTTGHEIPEDLELVRKARSLITASEDVRSMVFSVLDFAEMFGARTRPITRKIALIDEERKEANAKYIDGDYAGAAALYEDITGEYQDAQNQALDLKDRALLWVYIIEWLAVSGTSLLSGFVLYSLMVRRRMYRQVESTRTASKRRSL